MKKYLSSFAWVAAATLLGELARGKLAPSNIVILFLFPVGFSAFYLGRGPAIGASLAGVAAFDVLFVPPRFSLTVYDAQYLVTFAGFLLVGLTISELTSRLRERAVAAIAGERKAIALHRLSVELSQGFDPEKIRAIVQQTVRSGLRAESVLYLSSGAALRRLGPGEFPAADEAVVQWVFQNVQKAGHGTPLWPEVKTSYFPLASGFRALGVLGIEGRGGAAFASSEDRQWAESLANQTAVALERVLLFEETKKMELLAEKEKLQATLLNSLSHDLRTPLVSVTGALSHLAIEGRALSPAQKEMVDNARQEADRLNRLVTQWIDMAHAESGQFKILQAPCDLKDILGVALREMESALKGRALNVRFPTDLPEVLADYPMIVKVLANLLDNAVKYSPPGSPIDLSASGRGDRVELCVEDRGVGIPSEELPKIFDKFYRAAPSNMVPGTGLGLSICRAIAAAHGGAVTAENREGGGTRLRLFLPAVTS